MGDLLWFKNLRAILELLSFLAAPVVAAAAFWGLKQLGISKGIANTTAKREAFKLAADECRYYAKEIIPLSIKARNEYQRLGLTFANTVPTFIIDKGQILNHNFDLPLLHKELPQMGDTLVAYLNAVEGFALFFTSGVADEDIGFQETASAFCQAASAHMPDYFYMRHIKAAQYVSTIKLYELWGRRLMANSISPNIKPMQDFVREVGKQKISAIGTEH